MQLTRDERILEIQEGRDLLVYLLTIGDNWTMVTNLIVTKITYYLNLLQRTKD